MRNSIFYILLLIWSLNIQSQEIYYSSITPLPGNGLQTVIGSFDLLSCQKTELFVDTSFVNLEWIDIALCPDGNLYGLCQDGIYLIDLVADTYLKILDEPPYPRWEKGLLCTKDSILIFGERDILGYDINSEDLTYYGRLPNGMAIFTNLFYYNNMMMASAHPNRIIIIDTLDPANSTVYCSIDSSGLLSLTEVAVSCDSVAVFALLASGEVFLFNPIDFSLTFYCDVSGNPGEVFQGTDPNFMFMPPEPCYISIDLDYFNETLPGIDYADTILCALPAKILFSPIELYSDKQWDSLKVWIENGPSQVILEGKNSFFANLEGSGTNKLKYTQAASSDISQLSILLSELYLNGTLPPGITSMKIGFAAWAKNLKSDTAYAYITLIGRTSSAGEPGSKLLCKNDIPLDLYSLVSTNASLNGIWLPTTPILGTFNPMSDFPGQFYYIVDDVFCGKDSAVFNISTYPIPGINLQTFNYICPGDTALLELEVENSTITWPDGTLGSSFEVIAPDTLEVLVLDEFGCYYSDTAYVLLEDECILKRLYIPNIFSPDGNGINDRWEIKSDPTIISMEVTIYDRWGNALYHEKAPSLNWDGTTFNNQPLTAGVYVYALWLESLNKNRIFKTGDVTLLK